MIDIEHCTILGNETVDANSINRCMFNLHRKMVDAINSSVGSKSENIPESPFFSGGYDNMLEKLNNDYPELNLSSASDSTSGVVPRIYCGNLDIYGSRDSVSFSTESETGVYYYTSEELSTFAPSVSSLYGESTPMIFHSILHDESTVTTGTSSLGIASSPIVKFTSYLTCSNSGISFGTITFNRKNGDRQENTIILNITRDLIGIDGIESIDFFTIGNGFESGVETVSENLEMVSDISQCTVTYNSDNEVIVTNITKSDNSDFIKIEKETGRIVEDSESDDTYGKYTSISNDEVVLNFFTIFTVKENALKYSNDLWCFYVVNNFSYGKAVLNDANSWARDYFRYSFDNFEAADDGIEGVDGSHTVDVVDGCVIDASDAFNGCYNATFKSLCWFSPRLRYTERMFKGCTNATFDRIPSELVLHNIRSAVSMFENCMTATFGNITTINLQNANRMGMMFAGCTNATFDLLENLMVGGDASKMFYNDESSDFLSLKTIDGYGTRFNSMFEGCENAEFPKLEVVKSKSTEFEIDATRMFYGLKKPEFGNLGSIDICPDNNQHGYNGESMFEGCVNATFENLTSIGKVVDGTRMFKGCDPYFSTDELYKNRNVSTFSGISELGVGDSLKFGNEMFKDNYFLNMTITSDVNGLVDGTGMFENTSSVVFEKNLNSLVIGDNMFSNSMSAVVYGDMEKLQTAEGMFHNVHRAKVDGSMKSLVDARGMFLSSDEVDVLEFPSTVENAMNSFAYVSDYCNISKWEPSINDRYCDNAFYCSKNVSITGDIIAGKVISTANMFDSANTVVICNDKMQDENDDRHRFYSADAGENFSYIQKYDEISGNDSVSRGDFLFIGSADADTISSYITTSTSGDLQDSLFIVSTLKTKTVNYSIYSVEPSSDGYYEGSLPSVTLECEDLVFDSDSIVASSDYDYAPVSGYTTETLTSTGEFIIRREFGKVPSETETTILTTSYYLRNKSELTQTSDLRFISVTSYEDSTQSNCPRCEFEEFVTIGSSQSILKGSALNEGAGFKISLEGLGQSVGEPSSAKTSFDFDFIQISSYDNIIRPQLVINARNNERNSYALIPKGDNGTGGNNPEIEKLYEPSYGRMMVENSTDSIHVDVIEAHRYEDSEDLYGYLMRYKNKSYNDNRLVFEKNDGIPQDSLDYLLEDPKSCVGDFSIAQIFGNHSFTKDVPFSVDGDYSLSGTTRVETYFSIGNSDMAGTWKDASSMFHNVVQDSLLSGYNCFTDTSLEDVRHMFMLDERETGDNSDMTFANTGVLMQNLHQSNVSDMEGMFANRYVCNPRIFVDLWNESEDEYISFQIPENVENAVSAFKNCEIEDGEFTEIGLFIPPTLTGATEMLSGYVGPKIRFGYGNDPATGIYIADHIQCDNMFYGCEFTNEPDDVFGLSVPSIYIGMFEGSDFGMSSISSITVRNGMNFSNPYNNEVFFYNDTKLLGCSSISFDSLRTDVLDWFCSDNSEVEGVYLATVIGPKNDIRTTDGEPLSPDYSNYLSGDYRLMTGRRGHVDTDGDGDYDYDSWSTYMSKRELFTEEMISRMYKSTNDLKLNMMTEIENDRGRMTCMFNLPILFDCSTFDGLLGDSISSYTHHLKYEESYERFSDERYLSKTYNNMDFGLVERINAVELPFAFSGLSSATFDNLVTISRSAVMAYGAFMNCSSATFDKLESLSFAQNGVEQSDTMKSRFADVELSDDWYGNYCNMFAGCSSASMSSLNNLMLNSKYSTYGEQDNRVLTWLDVNGDINYMTNSNFSSMFTFSFYVDSTSGSIHVAISDRNRVKFVDYDTERRGEDSSTVEVSFFPAAYVDEILAKISINPLSNQQPAFDMYIDTQGNASTDENASFIGNYVPIPLQDVGRTYVVGEDGDYGIKTPKYLAIYRDVSGYHSIEVNSDFLRNINYRIHVGSENSKNGDFYSIVVHDNSDVDSDRIIESYVVSGVEVSNKSTFMFEMTEVNNELTPIITIMDSKGYEHIFEILANGTVEELKQHPRMGVVTALGYGLLTSQTFVDSNGEYLDGIWYSDKYGQNYTIGTGADDNGYYLLLKNGDDDVIRLGTNIPRTVEPSSASFNIGSYESNGLYCVIVTFAHEDKFTFYKVYNDAYFDEYGKAFKYVEQTEYDPSKPIEYKQLTDGIYFGDDIPISHKAYCSGMFMGVLGATFENLETISLPAIGSCAGMFESCSSADFGNIKYMVLPRTDRRNSDSDPGYLDYRGLFKFLRDDGDVNLGGISREDMTNIYALGIGGTPTLGYELFYGMYNSELERYYDDGFFSMTEDDAVNKLNLDRKIARRMEWKNGLTDFTVRVSQGDVFRFAVQTESDDLQVRVNWGDSSEIISYEGHSGGFVFISHEYLLDGDFHIKVSDNVLRLVVSDYGDSDYNNPTTFESLTGSDTKVVSVNGFGNSLRDLSYAFAGCLNLSRICDWPTMVKDVSCCYYGCYKIESTLPKWTDYVRNCSKTYYGCVGITDTYSDDASELMPYTMNEFFNCVKDSSDSLRGKFFFDWGGTGKNANSTTLNININE